MFKSKAKFNRRLKITEEICSKQRNLGSKNDLIGKESNY